MSALRKDLPVSADRMDSRGGEPPQQKVREDKTEKNQPQEPKPTGSASVAPYTMWVAHCPFRRSGSPVLGTMGSSIQGVIVMTTDEWRRLCDAVPQLQTTQFRVGTFDA